MNKQPTNINELYTFFMPSLIKPPVKSRSICSGIYLNRAGWHIEIYGRFNDDAMYMWFYSHPNRDPKWVMKYGKFTDPSQES